MKFNRCQSNSLSFLISTVGDQSEVYIKYLVIKTPIIINKNLEVISLISHYTSLESYLHKSESDNKSNFFWQS